LARGHCMCRMVLGDNAVSEHAMCVELRSRDVNRGQMLEAKAEAEVKFNRPSPRPKLKRPNRTQYFTMKIYAIETLCDH